MPEPPMMPSTDLVICSHLTSLRAERSKAISLRLWMRERLRLLRRAFALLAMTDNIANEGPRTGPFVNHLRRRRSVHGGPHLLLGEVEQAREHDQEDHDLQAEALARLEMRLGGPHHE